jgi:hypothetical protein
MVFQNPTDTISSVLVDTVSVSPGPDRIPVPQERAQDTLIAPDADTVGIGIDPAVRPIDTLPLIIDDTVTVAAADSAEQIPVERYEATPREALVREIPAAVRMPPEELKGPPRYDGTFYLEHDTGSPFFRENPFIMHAADNRDNLTTNPVFVEAGPGLENNATDSYHEYMQKDMNGDGYEKLHYSGAWIPGLLVLSFLLLTWIKLIYVQFLTPLLISSFNYKEATKLYHGKNAPAQNAFHILHAIFAINGGLFFLFVAGFFDLKLPYIQPVLIFLILSGSLVLVFSLKSIALGVVGFLFNKSALFSEYKHNIFVYNKIYGIALLPVIVGLLYAGDVMYVPLIYSGLLLGAVFYLLQLLRGLEIIMRKEFSVFYLILYLCAFEILPILVLYKLFQCC